MINIKNLWQGYDQFKILSVFSVNLQLKIRELEDKLAIAEAKHQSEIRGESSTDDLLLFMLEDFYYLYLLIYYYLYLRIRRRCMTVKVRHNMM